MTLNKWEKIWGQKNLFSHFNRSYPGQGSISESDDWKSTLVFTWSSRNPCEITALVLLKVALEKGKDIGLRSKAIWFPDSCSTVGFPSGSESKDSACTSGNPGSIPGMGRSPGEGNHNTLWYSCPENPMDRGAWWAIVHGIANSQTWPSGCLTRETILQLASEILLEQIV